MTSRTRKLTVGVALLVSGAIAGLALAFRVREPAPPMVTLVRYQPGETNAIVQITSRNGAEFYHCWAAYDSGRLPDSYTATSGSVAPRETLAVQVPILKEAGWPLLIRVSCYPKRSGIGQLAADALSFFGVDIENGFETNIDLPSPPKTPLP